MDADLSLPDLKETNPAACMLFVTLPEEKKKRKSFNSCTTCEPSMDKSDWSGWFHFLVNYKCP